MRNRLLPTAFSGPMDNAHEADALKILVIFSCYSHIDTRNGCLRALKYATAGKGPEGYFSFDSRSANDQTYQRFEHAIRGLYQLLETVQAVGIWRKEKLEDWYREAIETMMDAYLRVASRTYMRAGSDLHRPLRFLFKMMREGKSPTGPGKDLKHVLFYTSSYFDQEKEVKYVQGLEKFLASRLNRFVDDLCGGKFDQQDWEPVKKILEFMIDKKFYKRKLVKLVRQMKQLLETAVNLEGERSSKVANQRFAYQQALSIAEFVLAEPSLK